MSSAVMCEAICTGSVDAILPLSSGLHILIRWRDTQLTLPYALMMLCSSHVSHAKLLRVGTFRASPARGSKLVRRIVDLFKLERYCTHTMPGGSLVLHHLLCAQCDTGKCVPLSTHNLVHRIVGMAICKTAEFGRFDSVRTKSQFY